MFNNVGLILLAAGSSSRLGESKQLLLFEGKTLIKRSADVATSSNCYPVIIVLGDQADEHIRELEAEKVIIIINPIWETGIGSSIACGIKALGEFQSTLDGVIIMLCDQPFINANTLNQLIEKGRLTGKGIVASQYAKTIGTPALFSPAYFSMLQELKENQGAKALIKENLADLGLYDFPQGEIDIDTKHDYLKLLNIKHT